MPHSQERSDSAPETPERKPRRGSLILGVLLLLAQAFRGHRPRGRKPPLFPRWSNAALLGVLIFAGVAAVAVLALLIRRPFTPAVTGQLAALEQPVPFSHQLHVTGFEIDCRYCHTSAERTATAGMPSTATCVPCHNDVWLNSAAFEPVRRSLATGGPIPWLRVHDIPDYATFHHGAHTTAGVGCETCHGRVDRMHLVVQDAPLTMAWCLDCHREPERFLRPRVEITTMGYAPPIPQLALGDSLKRLSDVADGSELTYCSVCHY